MGYNCSRYAYFFLGDPHRSGCNAVVVPAGLGFSAMAARRLCERRSMVMEDCLKMKETMSMEGSIHTSMWENFMRVENMVKVHGK